MLNRTILPVLGSLLGLLAPSPAEAVQLPIGLYQNDFTTRESAGLIGGSTTFNYSLGNLVGSQDQWIRRNTGVLGVTVADPTATGNPHARIASGSSFAYAVHPIGSQATEGTVRVSVDVLTPNIWQGSTRNTTFFLGDDDFNSSETGSVEDNPMTFHAQTASVFGFRSQSGSNDNIRFVVRNGNGDGTHQWTHGDATVATETWYRFVADLNLADNKYSVDVYELGTTAPTMATPTPDTPVQSFANMGFLRNMGDEQVHLNGISTLGIASFGNATDVGFDNISISRSKPGYYSFVDATNLGGSINSSAADVMPRISDDGLRLFFLSDRGATRDVYLATRSHVSEDFAAAVRLGGNISQSGYGSSCTFETSDGLNLYFRRDDQYHVATRPDKNTPWDDPSVTYTTDGLQNLDGTPSDISRDGSTLIGYSSDQRLYVSYWDDVNEEWSEPETIATNGLFPNTGNDLQPSFSPDELTIYFASSRWEPDGGSSWNIMAISRLDYATPWTDTSLLTGHFVEGINSATEIGPFMYGNRLYFQSSRSGGIGGYDLYAAIVPEPNTGILLAFSALALLTRFGRRRNRRI